MTIKIIALGTHPKDRVYTAKCHYCQTVVEFKEADAHFTKAYDQRDQDSLHVSCPVCSSSIITYT